jgi:hypothetical protein
MAVALDDDAALHDDKELVTGFALAHQHVAVGSASLDGELGQTPEVRHVEALEERHLSE